MDSLMILLEEFNHKDINKGLKWFSPPQHWNHDSECATFMIRTDKQTDFWQKTHYGFEADNGHFLYYDVNEDFRLTTKVHSKPKNRYDQAGLMVRYSKDTWIKTSVEYIPGGKSKLGAVVTKHGYSDWSSQAFSQEDFSLYYRITKKESDFYVEYSVDGDVWTQIRMTHLPEATHVQAGIYACSPQGEGYEAAFDFIKIEKVHDQTTVYE
ncbi:DUF1349 domain-containing protein [Domibacillus indicus]|uniref:DUF1349 domain-containing protein n=1 Tax=Domibacillus indicus TaxID=1437523 RepID=UPI00203D4D91|nr:DUF1349 domain-containing protein [Domibacillus indicus]MCM3789900.1 DUF1349 domain-containing protein [Domibacillus indicus]